jgi:hypothetical protein
MDHTNFEGEDRTNQDFEGEDDLLRSRNDAANAKILNIIRSELGLPQHEDFLGEELEEELDQVDELEISSFFNPSGDGEEQDQEDEGQTNNDDGPSTTTGEVYIYKSSCALDALIDPYIYIY